MRTSAGRCALPQHSVGLQSGLTKGCARGFVVGGRGTRTAAVAAGSKVVGVRLPGGCYSWHLGGLTGTRVQPLAGHIGGVTWGEQHNSGDALLSTPQGVHLGCDMYDRIHGDGSPETCRTGRHVAWPQHMLARCEVVCSACKLELHTPKCGQECTDCWVWHLRKAGLLSSCVGLSADCGACRQAVCISSNLPVGPVGEGGLGSGGVDVPCGGQGNSHWVGG